MGVSKNGVPPKYVSGYRSRPVLPEVVEHVFNMQQLVEESHLKYPYPYSLDARGPRVTHPLDETSHAVRLKRLRSIDNEVRKFGKPLV